MGDKDFFLSPDDAMTMGDIEYMRKPKRVRRTFPKTASNKGGFAVETEVSANEDRSGMFKGNNSNQNTNVNTVFNPTPSTQFQPAITNGAVAPQANVSVVPQVEPVEPAAPAPQPTVQTPQPTPEERRQADDGMDMFRNMAKKMRGRR